MSKKQDDVNVKVSGNQIGFCSLLALLFITLKLTGVITWSWWWVLAPIWIPALIGIVIFIIVLIICFAIND